MNDVTVSQEVKTDNEISYLNSSSSRILLIISLPPG